MFIPVWILILLGFFIFPELFVSLFVICIYLLLAISLISIVILVGYAIFEVLSKSPLIGVLILGYMISSSYIEQRKEITNIDNA